MNLLKLLGKPTAISTSRPQNRLRRILSRPRLLLHRGLKCSGQCLVLAHAALDALDSLTGVVLVGRCRFRSSRGHFGKGLLPLQSQCLLLANARMIGWVSVLQAIIVTALGTSDLNDFLDFTAFERTLVDENLCKIPPEKD